MTLTIELDLDTVQVDLHVKFLVRKSNGSVVRVLADGHTHRQTGPILLPQPLARKIKRGREVNLQLTNNRRFTGTF